ncbi:Arc35 protein [Starmerella bacillaris]|uniref:Arp2/3 complex 34 kDa subunit n=1 Tax=Starmerella bacillaris TaxID=1247836 RepID=A0AAV5RIK6_STABA|nr:Arc35 protein [Starmerella bacillaris]
MSQELLEYHNVLLKSIFTEAIVDQQEPVKIDQVVSDFDNVMFHISTPESKTKILLSIVLKSWPDLEKYGAKELLKAEYEGFVTETEVGYNFSLLVDLENLPCSTLEDRTLLVDKLSLLKRNAMAAPFELAFQQFDEMSKEAQQFEIGSYTPTDAQTEVMAIKYRDEETIYIQPNWDRVTIIFSTGFKDETDQVLGKVFLQEFVDARRRALQNAPQVMFSKEPPLEVQRAGFNGQLRPDQSFITFVLFPQHIIPQRRERAISHIQTFRDYFHFHIKSSKAFVHSRMRHRTGEFLKVLNRAKPENLEKSTRKI